MMKKVTRFISTVFLILVFMSIHSETVSAQSNPIETITLVHDLTEGSIFYYRLFHMCEELGKRTGIKIELKNMPLKRALRSSNAGVVDGEAARIRALSNNPEYPNLRIVDAPWMVGTMKAIVKKGSGFDISGWSGLKNYRFCYSRGVLLIEDMIKKHNLTKSHSLTIPMQALEQINLNRCDVTAYWYEQYSPGERRFMKENDLVPASTLTSIEGFIYLHKSRESLIPVMREVLLEMEKDGTRKRIFEESERY